MHACARLHTYIQKVVHTRSDSSVSSTDRRMPECLSQIQRIRTRYSQRDMTPIHLPPYHIIGFQAQRFLELHARPIPQSSCSILCLTLLQTHLYEQAVHRQHKFQWPTKACGTPTHIPTQFNTQWLAAMSPLHSGSSKFNVSSLSQHMKMSNCSA